MLLNIKNRISALQDNLVQLEIYTYTVGLMSHNSVLIESRICIEDDRKSKPNLKFCRSSTRRKRGIIVKDRR